MKKPDILSLFLKNINLKGEVTLFRYKYSEYLNTCIIKGMVEIYVHPCQVVMYGLFNECKFLTIEETNKKK